MTHHPTQAPPRLFLLLVGMVTLFGGLAGRHGPFSSPPPCRAPRGFSVHLSLGCLSSAIIRPLLPPLPAFWFAARFAGPLFMTKISECNAFELTQRYRGRISVVASPDMMVYSLCKFLLGFFCMPQSPVCMCGHLLRPTCLMLSGTMYLNVISTAHRMKQGREGGRKDGGK